MAQSKMGGRRHGKNLSELKWTRWVQLTTFCWALRLCRLMLPCKRSRIFVLKNLVVERKGPKCASTTLRSASFYLRFPHLSYDFAFVGASLPSAPGTSRRPLTEGLPISITQGEVERRGGGESAAIRSHPLFRPPIELSKNKVTRFEHKQTPSP